MYANPHVTDQSSPHLHLYTSHLSCREQNNNSIVPAMKPSIIRSRDHDNIIMEEVTLIIQYSLYSQYIVHTFPAIDGLAGLHGDRRDSYGLSSDDGDSS